MKKVAHYVIKGEIELLSGMHIGGSDDVLQIGGIDLTCIKDPVTGRPYIPGSSLKGKMRSSLEKVLDKYTADREGRNREPCGCAQADCPVCRVFGPQRPDHKLGPTRIIVRDAPLVGEFTLENKTESTNKRDTGGAYNPRTVERVAPGARFQLEIGVQEYDVDREFKYTDADGKSVTGLEALRNVVEHAVTLMEDSGIGSGISKGYGRIHITITDERELPQRRRLRRAAPGDAQPG